MNKIQNREVFFFDLNTITMDIMNFNLFDLLEIFDA